MNIAVVRVSAENAGNESSQAGRRIGYRAVEQISVLANGEGDEKHLS